MAAKRLFKRGLCYAVYYLDHYAQPTKSAWVRPSKIKSEPCVLVTVGFVVKETAVNVVMAQSVDKVYDPKEAVGNVWVIAKGAIQDIVPLNIEVPQ